MEISAPTPEESLPLQNLRPAEGWHVLHLFYQLDYAQWELLSDEDRLEAKTEFTRLAQEIRTAPETQLLVFSVVTPKADVGFMLLTPDLHDANRFEKRLSRSLGADILTPVYSYLSITERSEYTTTVEQYRESLKSEEGLEPGSDKFQRVLDDFKSRMERYTDDRLYPEMPDWPVFCFYNVSMRRDDSHNWYALDFETRRKLMLAHADIGKSCADKVRQLTTGSTGLDDAEWGVTLFAHDTTDIKNIVYKMRFDEASATYADFGDFYIGVQLPLDELFRRLDL